MLQARSPSRDWLFIAPVILLSLFVRLRSISETSLWCDEINQVTNYYAKDYKTVMYGAAKVSQPPLDYWIGYLVFKFNQSDAAARFPAAIFGTLLVLCTYFLARVLVDRWIATLIAIGLACSPFVIHYSQEARPYCIFWFSLVFSILLLQRAWSHNRWWDWALFMPVVFFCQFTRGLAPLMMTTGMGLWALGDLLGEFRVNGRSIFRRLAYLRGPRLLACLAVAWIPFLNLLSFLIHRSRKGNYLAENVGQVFDWNNNLMALKMVGQSLFKCAVPIGIILIPLGLCGMFLYLKQNDSAERKAARAIFVPLLLGFVVHVLVYTFMVIEAVPKYVYWGYALPFLYVGAGCAVQIAVQAWRKRGLGAGAMRLTWALAVVVLMLQLTVDDKTAVLHRPDWRGALQSVSAAIDPLRDVAFCSEAVVYGTGGMVFRVSPHYWPTDQHKVNVYRHPEKMFNDGQPVLGRRNCRVALMLRCDPDLGGEELAARMSERSKVAFEFHDFHGFVTLVSRVRYETADAGFVELAGAVEEMLGEGNELGVHTQMGLAWVALKRGDIEQTGRIYSASRQLIRPQYLDSFDQDYEELRGRIEESGNSTVRLITYPKLETDSLR